MDPNANLSLLEIYQSCKYPTKSSSVACRKRLQAASLQSITPLLHQVLSLPRQPERNWPTLRSIRCLDYIFLCTSHITRDLIQLPTFQQCFRFACDKLRIDAIPANFDNESATTMMHEVTRLICHLLEWLKSSNATPDPSLLRKFKHAKGVSHVLQWLACPDPKIRLYCTRILSVLDKDEAGALIFDDAFWALAGVLSRVPDLLAMHSQLPKVNRSVEWDVMLKTCRMLERLVKFAKDSPHAEVSAKLSGFIASVNFLTVFRAWEAACEAYVKGVDVRRLQAIVYSLTSIMSKCTAMSEAALEYVTLRYSEWNWHRVMAQDMLHFVRSVHTQEPIHDNAVDQLARHISQLSQMNLRVALSQVQLEIRKSCAESATLNTTNFLTAIACQPLGEEQLFHLASGKLISGVDRYSLRATTLFTQYEPLLATLFEDLIQNVQLVSWSKAEPLSSNIGLSLLGVWTSLDASGTLSTSGLKPRLQKLTLYITRFPDAVSQLANAPSALDHQIWGPVIEYAKSSLQCAAAQELDSATDEYASVIRRAKLAFAALQTSVSNYYASAHLLDLDVLQLVREDYIPRGEVLEQNQDMLALYSVFAEAVGTLMETMALARTQSLRENPVVPFTMKLIHEAIARFSYYYNSQSEQEAHLVQQWRKIMMACLHVVYAFRFGDMAFLQKWVYWPTSVQDVEVPAWHAMLRVNKEHISIVPLLLRSLFPWSSMNQVPSTKDMPVKLTTNDLFLMYSAACCLEVLSKTPEFTRQLVRDNRIPQQLCQLLVNLSKMHKENQSPVTINHSPNHSPKQVETAPPEWPVVVPSLFNGLISSFISTENSTEVVLNDTFTALFAPLTNRSDDEQGCKDYWIHRICDILYQTRRDDYRRLFTFSADNDQAIKLHEMLAVAIGYAYSPKQRLHDILFSDMNMGLHANGVFGVLCYMLVYDLTPNGDNANEHHPGSVASTRRHAAAQVIQVMAENFMPVWLEQLQAQKKDTERNWRHIQQSIQEDSDTVSFLSQDANATPIVVNRLALTQESPYFAALLSGEYAESSSSPIVLQDVSEHDLQLFFQMVTVSAKAEHVDAILPSTSCWGDVVSVLLVADRFGSQHITNICNAWILEKLMSKTDLHDSLNGALLLYRRCRSPLADGGGLTMTSWPFHDILRASFTMIVGHLSHACNTPEYRQMIQACDDDELEMFCKEIHIILQDALLKATSNNKGPS